MRASAQRRGGGVRAAPSLGGVLLVLSSLALAAGCVQKRNIPTDVHSSASPVYLRALEAQTRSARIYRDFEERAVVTATLETPAFLVARFDELARIQLLTPDQREQRLADYRAAHPGVTVVVYLDAEKRRWEALDVKGQWNVSFVADGHEVGPTEVSRLDENDPNLRYLFPWVDDFGSLYLLTFPPDTQTERLVVGSALGRVELSFRRR